MNKETRKDNPRQQTNWDSSKQTGELWNGNPEKKQRSEAKKIDPDKGRKLIRIEQALWDELLCWDVK